MCRIDQLIRCFIDLSSIDYNCNNIPLDATIGNCFVNGTYTVLQDMINVLESSYDISKISSNAHKCKEIDLYLAYRIRDTENQLPLHALMQQHTISHIAYIRNLLNKIVDSGIGEGFLVKTVFNHVGSLLSKMYSPEYLDEKFLEKLNKLLICCLKHDTAYRKLKKTKKFFDSQLLNGTPFYIMRLPSHNYDLLYILPDDEFSINKIFLKVPITIEIIRIMSQFIKLRLRYKHCYRSYFNEQNIPNDYHCYLKARKILRNKTLLKKYIIRNKIDNYLNILINKLEITILDYHCFFPFYSALPFSVYKSIVTGFNANKHISILTSTLDVNIYEEDYSKYKSILNNCIDFAECYFLNVFLKYIYKNNTIKLLIDKYNSQFEHKISEDLLFQYYSMVSSYSKEQLSEFKKNNPIEIDFIRKFLKIKIINWEKEWEKAGERHLNPLWISLEKG